MSGNSRRMPFNVLRSRTGLPFDRLRSQNDYRVNLKAELEIRLVHEKIDHLISTQWHRLAEIQAMQLEIMQERRRH